MSNQRQKDLLSTLMNQLWRLVSGPLLLLLIPFYLLPEQQGYWFLFGSISALSSLADLGFTNIVLQFSAHEYAFLHFNEKNLLAGDEVHLKRLGSFFRFIVKWFSVLCGIAFPVIYIVGFVFFVRDGVSSTYWFPWTLYSFGAMLIFFCNGILSFIEGLDKIARIQKVRFVVSIINTGIVFVVLLIGWNIYALALGMLINASLAFILVFFSFGRMLKELFVVSRNFSYNWKEEIIPLFTKYAIGSICGYSVFQIYTPVMHYFHGPVYSGKVGITISLVLSLLNISSIWIYTVTPKINILISKKMWPDLDLLFRKRVWLSLGTYISGILVLFIFLYYFKEFWIIPKILTRFLPIESVICLFVGYFFQLIINSMAVYLRGHKQEPLMGQAILQSAWIVPVTILAGKYFPLGWIFIGFLASYVFIFPINLMIFFKNRKNWHLPI